MSQPKQLDIALFGATGFTGGLVAEYLASVAQKQPLRWALVGRSRDKLEAVKARIAQRYPEASQLSTLIADSGDEESLRALAAQAKVIITTVGPYAKYGELLVKACAQVGADYVDLTGEPGFVDTMIERYHDSAKQRGAKIVHACGFDSIPHDMGAYFTLHALRAQLSERERVAASVTIEGFVRAGGTFSGGTLHSAVNAMASMRSDEKERKRRALARTNHRDDGRSVRSVPPRFGFRKELGLWTLPMPTIDPQIVLRSARALPEYGPDFKYGHYLGLRHMHQAVGLAAGVGAMFAMAQAKPTRQLLLKMRDPGDGPSEAEREKGWFKVTFLAKAAGHHVKCEVSGGDPGYGETAKMLSESALCLAFDREQLPPAAGIVTTAAGLGDPLLARLKTTGIKFSELS